MNPEGLRPEDLEKIKRDDLRAEYNAVVSYHTALVVARFTIAGLLMGGSAFLASAAFSPDRPPPVKALCGAFAAWLTLCAWWLELRSRALYRKIAGRGVQIEHGHGALQGNDWYAGFFSRQYNIEPPPDYVGKPTPPKPGPDVTTLFGCRLVRLAKCISHSNAFDSLYAGALALWLAIACYYAYRTWRGPDGPTFPLAPGYRYTVYVGEKQFVVDSVRFQDGWIILEGGYPALKAMWIRREQVSVIQVPNRSEERRVGKECRSRG